MLFRSTTFQEGFRSKRRRAPQLTPAAFATLIDHDRRVAGHDRFDFGQRSNGPLLPRSAPCETAASAACPLLQRLRSSFQPGTHGRQHRFRPRVQEPVPRVRVLTIDGHPEFTKFAALLLDPGTRPFQLRRHTGGDGCPNGSDRTVVHHYRFHGLRPLQFPAHGSVQ